MEFIYSEGDQLFKILQEDTEGFEALSQFLKEIAGINLPLTMKNRCLMASRLCSVLKEYGYNSYTPFIELLNSGDTTAATQFVTSLTTNTTHFFREAKHFDILKNEIPALLKRKEKSGLKELRVWCCAASSGQEPYSIAITLLESIPNPQLWSLKFLASDIDIHVLEKASRGVYSENEIESLPPLYRQKYFTKMEKNVYQAKPFLRQLINFASFNLITEKYPFQHPFDIVFCRNVLIYFETTASQAIVNKISATVGTGGLLFLGHSESGAMRNPLMSQIAAAAYRKESAGWKK
jgi:chemotaxis protein methyltransferase CheR